VNKSILAALFLLVFNASAHAGDITVAQYKDAMAADEQTAKMMKVYVSALGEGLKWSNVFLARQKKAPLYCAPATMGLNGTNYIDALDQQIKVSEELGLPNVNEMPVGLLLVVGLQSMLPCNAK
jgi:hypothetical protein